MLDRGAVDQRRSHPEHPQTGQLAEAAQAVARELRAAELQILNVVGGQVREVRQIGRGAAANDEANIAAGRNLDVTPGWTQRVPIALLHRRHVIAIGLPCRHDTHRHAGRKMQDAGLGIGARKAERPYGRDFGGRYVARCLGRRLVDRRGLVGRQGLGIGPGRIGGRLGGRLSGRRVGILVLAGLRERPG